MQEPLKIEHSDTDEGPTDVDDDGYKSTIASEKSGKMTEAQRNLEAFWPNAFEEVKKIKQVDGKNQVLPLARIKKIMKLDEHAKMIAAEAPLLFAKGAEIFIQELTLRAWVHTEDNKRRTLQRSDISTAISRCDQFDFLIDIVPREEVKPTTPRKETPETPKPATSSNDQVQYYLQLAQQHQQALQNPTVTNHQTNTGNLVNQQGIPITNTGLGNVTVGPQSILLTTNAISGNPGQQQTVLGNSIQNPQHQQIQILQQVVTPNGELTHMPITITQNQLNLLRMHMQGNASTTTAQPQQILIPTMQTQQQPSLVQVSSAGQQNTNTGSIFINTGQATLGTDKRTINTFHTNC